MYEQRFYREWTDPGSFESYELKMGQSDLFITCPAGLRSIAKRSLAQARSLVEQTIEKNDDFLSALRPLSFAQPAAPLIERMGAAARDWEVGPMASVAGAVAEYVGRALVEAGAPSVIVENGGDTFCFSGRKLRFALYAGEESPFGDKLAFRVDAREGVGVCTSSGRVGPSLSFGNADAVVVVAKNTAYADAAATAIANEIKCENDVDVMLERFRKRSGILGLIICLGDRLGVAGDIELSPR